MQCETYKERRPSVYHFLQSKSSTPMDLRAVAQKQAGPYHWSIWVGPDGENGEVWQVNGDAECMTFKVS
jgi:hypothetical protein